MPRRFDPSAPLTWREGKAFRFIDTYVAENHMSPTMRQVGDAAGLKSVGSVHYMLGRLEQKGYIIRRPSHRGGMTAHPARAGRVLVRSADLRLLLDNAMLPEDPQVFQAYTALAGAIGS